MRRSIIYIIFIIISVISPSQVFAGAYSDLFNEVTFSSEQQEIFNGLRIIYHGSSKQQGEKILQEVKHALTALEKFYNSDIDLRCKSLDLNIYQIDNEILNNRDIMSFISWKNLNRIDGYYDGNRSPKGTASIFISYSPVDSQKEVIAHETAHYWQHIMYNDTNEKQALEFENFYILYR
jgi:hypothetical protein